MSAARPPDVPLPAPFRTGRAGLEVDGVLLRDLAGRFGTPLYVTSARRIRENAGRFAAAFRAEWPRYELLYALKANPNPGIVRLLAAAGCGADCSSPAEIRLAREAGVPRERTLYTAAYPSSSELAAALAGRVTINLDDPALLPALLREGRPERLSFRINPGRTSSGPEGLKFAGHGAKFGVPLSRAIEGFRAARRAGLERFGLHTMPGSNVLDPEHFAFVGRFLGSAYRRIEREAGIRLEFLDAGGGFGVPYRPGERPLDIARVARRFAEGLRAGLGRPLPPGEAPTVCHEPGRFLVADSTVLLTRVTHVKEGRPLLVGVDAGMQTLLRPALYQAYHPLHALGPRRGTAVRANLVGPVCENTDVLARDRWVVRPNVGDLFAVGNAGAYGFSMSSQYNTRPRPGELLVDGGRSVVLREPESFDDLVARVPAEVRGPIGGSPGGT